MKSPNVPDLAAENAELRARLAKAERILATIRTGGPAGGLGKDNAPEEKLRQLNHELEDLVRRRTSALQASEARYRLLFDRNPDGVFAVDPTGRFVLANPACEAISGYSRVELEQKTFMEICAPDQLARTLEHFERVLHKGKSLPLETAMVRKDGRRVEVWVAGEPLLIDQKLVVHCTAKDITERKRAEQKLLESEARAKVAAAVQTERQRLYDLLETLPAMVCLLTPDYHVAFANRSFRQKFGEAMGRRCYEHCFGRSEPCAFCESYNVLKTGQPHHWEVKCPDGSVVDAYDFPFTDVDGTPMILEMDLDITERRQAEAELKQHREHLEDLVRQRTAALHETNKELNRFNQAMVGRELRMIELKKEVNA